MRSVVVLFALLIACTKPNPNVCCVTEEQCNTLGADELRPCGVGQACSTEFSCVAAECETSADWAMSRPLLKLERWRRGDHYADCLREATVASEFS